MPGVAKNAPELPFARFLKSQLLGGNRVLWGVIASCDSTESCLEQFASPGHFSPFTRSDEMSTVEERLRQLESSHRRWRLAAFGLGAALLCAVAMGAELNGQKRVLRVQGIEVVNDQGERLIWIGQGSLGEGAMETYNNRGKRVTLITSNERGDGLLNIANNDARRVFAGSANDRGDGLLEVFNSNGVNVSLVGANHRGDGLINAANKRGMWVSAMAADKNGEGIVETFTPSQKLTSKLP
jgi:hypothetical protein